MSEESNQAGNELFHQIVVNPIRAVLELQRKFGTPPVTDEQSKRYRKRKAKRSVQKASRKKNRCD